MATFGLRDMPLQNAQEELLGLDTYADALGDFVEKCATPMTIALQGDWGSGKTSLMNLIAEKLKAQNIFTFVWFNTWQYSQFGLKNRLASSLIQYFINKLPASQEQTALLKLVKNGFRNLRSFAAKGGKALGYAVGGISGDAIKAVSHAIDTDTENLEPEEFIENLKLQLNTTVMKSTENGKRKIVVFIDDLDRVEPIRAVELLESFKLFLDIPYCIFILACDYKVVIQGLKAKFGEVGFSSEKNFFDKIIQLPFRMPVQNYDAEKYIKQNLDNIGITYKDDDIKVYRKIVEYSIGFNPRGLKRAFNSLLLNIGVAQKKGVFQEGDASVKASKTEKNRMMFAAICMQGAFEDLYTMFAKEKISLGFFDTLNKKKDKSDEFERILSELSEKNSHFNKNKCVNFVNVLFEAMQLDSDREGNTVLVQEEFDEFISILKFSGITSTVQEEEIILEDDEEYDKEKRKEIREICETLLEKFKKDTTVKTIMKRMGRSYMDLRTQ